MAREVNSREWVWTGSIWVPRAGTGDGEAKAALMGWDGADWQDLLVERAANPNLRVRLYARADAITAVYPDDDTLAVTNLGIQTVAPSYTWNGTYWERERSNYELTLLARATRSTDTWSATIANHNSTGLILALEITARTVGVSPLIRIAIAFVDPASGSAAIIYQTPDFDPTIDLHYVLLFPGAAAPGVGSYDRVEGYASIRIPRRFHAGVILVSDVTDITYSLGATLLR